MKKLKLTNLILEPSPIRLVEQNGEPSKTLEASGDVPLPQFTLLAYTGNMVKTRDIPLPIVVDMSGVNIPTQKISVRYEHKSFQGVGHTEKIAIVGTDIIAEGVISRDTCWSRDIVQSARNGFPWQASMGGAIHNAEYIPAGQSVTVNGKTFEGEIYVVRKMTGHVPAKSSQPMTIFIIILY
jgi:hypothetical protein